MHPLAGIEWFGMVFGGFGGLFLLLGLGMAHAQSRKLRTYLAVPATVTGAEVVENSGSGDGGPTYRPRVQYTYTTPTGEHQSDKTMAVDGISTSNRNWAQRIIARYPAGLSTQAYVDPDDDTKVFLVHEASTMPYLFALFSMIFVTIGLAVATSDGTPGGWSTADRILALVIFWHSVGLVCLMHYRLAGGRLTLGPQIMFMFYGGIGMIGLIAWDHVRHQPPPRPVMTHVAPHPKPHAKPATRPHRPSTRPTTGPLPPVERP